MLNNSPAAIEIAKHLPIKSTVTTWGDEIYFDKDITAPRDNETMELNIGDITYWPRGKCLCVFFGPTPASKDSKPVPADYVVIVGKTEMSPDNLRKIKDGTPIEVIAA